MSIARKFKALWYYIKPLLLNLNIFNNQSTDPVEIYRQILSTRVFFILFTSSICILVGYSALSLQSRTVTVNKPSLETFLKINASQGNKSTCVCQTMSVSYGTFVQTKPVFHQLCSSDFINQTWIDYVATTNLQPSVSKHGQKAMSSMWKITAALCQNSMHAVSDGLSIFKSTQHTKSTIVSDLVLYSEVETILAETIRMASDSLMRSFNILEGFTDANAYVTGLNTDALLAVITRPFTQVVGQYFQRISFLNMDTGYTCNCHAGSSCAMPMSLFFTYENSGTYSFYGNLASVVDPSRVYTGLMIDCFPLTATFASSLECFFDQTCLALLISSYSQPINVSVLDESITSRFQPNNTIKQLFNELFLEQIIKETSFADYYAGCAPISCSYSYSSRFDLIFVITTLVALIGGLNVALRFITPRSVGIFFYLKQKLLTQSHTRETPRTSSMLESETNLCLFFFLEIFSF